MDALVITTKGLEDVSAEEIYQLIKKKSVIKETVVLFDATEQDLCTLCYLGRSFSRVIAVSCIEEIHSLEEAKKKIAFAVNQEKGKTFAVRCERIGTHDFTSQDVERTIGAYIHDQGLVVQLEKPTYTFFVYVYNNTWYIGIDYGGIDLSKRDYKVFPHPTSMRGTIAYALTQIAQYTAKKTLLDPFCGSGTIVIEAALAACNISLRFYKKEFAFQQFTSFDFKREDAKANQDTETHLFGTDVAAPAVKAAEKNARIAGVLKRIAFSRLDVEWLDTKQEKQSVDCIVTHPPELSKQADAKKVERAYNDLFYNAAFILKKKGKVVMLMKNSEVMTKYAHLHHFKKADEKIIEIGKEKLFILVFMHEST